MEEIEKRTSRRTFEKEELTISEIDKMNSYIEKRNKESGLQIVFLEDGSSAFSNMTKSYGLFSNVKSLILMKGNRHDDNLKEKVGYYGEDLVLYLTSLGLGTCWVGGTFDKDKILLEEEEQLVCVIVVGKIKEPTLKEKLIRNTISKKRKTIEQRLITDTNSIPQWIVEGMQAVILAPSAKNSQKPVFEYLKGVLTAKVSNEDTFDLVDLGIAKKHFELLANSGRFEIGNNAIFKLSKV